MSLVDLFELLADPERGGAYFVDVRDRTDAGEAATQLGFATFVVELRGCISSQDALERLARALELPDWFGGNWDALSDCLRDLSWAPAAGYVLLLDHAGDWREADPEGFRTLLDVLDEAATDWRAEHVPFWALVPLPTDALPRA